mgnify:CR=1 FL=1
MGSGTYGQHLTIAVEASNAVLPVLARNIEDLKNEVRMHHRAISNETGVKLTLYGDRHAGFSINDQWYGASKTAANEVEAITIDGLLAIEGIDYARHPVLVKLDVEGAELKAVRGAAKLLEGQSAFIVEDVEKDDCSDAARDHEGSRERGMLPPQVRAASVPAARPGRSRRTGRCRPRQS